MAATASTMLPLGTTAQDFQLPDTTGSLVSRDDFARWPALLVMFLCNHCPYVKHVAEEVVRLSAEYQARGVGIVAISSNDVAQFPEDAPARMGEVAAAMGFTVPYLYDETQEVARAYHAACTPDFFLFDADMKLVYRGQLDDSRPQRPSGGGNDIPVTGKDLRAAMDAVVAGKRPDTNQRNSIGCNIKWRE